MTRTVALVLAVAVLGVAPANEKRLPPLPAPPKQLPVDDPKSAAIVLMDDHAERLVPHLNNDNDPAAPMAAAAAEEWDAYSGATALRVAPLQRFRGNLPGWSYPIRETPQPGEFRFVRFAWKKVGGADIMIQFNNADNHELRWNQRYIAGRNGSGWPAKSVADAIPTEWTVVTRDLFADFGKMTLSGIAFTPADGEAGLFDHVLLGRTVADLDAKSDELLGKTKPKVKLDGKARDDAWAAFGGRDAEKAGPAIRAFLAAAPEQVNFVRDRLTAVGSAGEKALRARVADLVVKLGSDDFEVRTAADAELEQLGDAAREEIGEAAKSPNAEVEYRAKRLAVRLRFAADATPLPGIRAARVARVLERAATADAKKLLGEMAAGDFGPFHAVAAKAALGRAGK